MVPKVPVLVRRYNVSGQSIYRWRAKYAAWKLVTAD